MDKEKNLRENIQLKMYSSSWLSLNLIVLEELKLNEKKKIIKNKIKGLSIIFGFVIFICSLDAKEEI